MHDFQKRKKQSKLKKILAAMNGNQQYPANIITTGVKLNPLKQNIEWCKVVRDEYQPLSRLNPRSVNSEKLRQPCSRTEKSLHSGTNPWGIVKQKLWHCCCIVATITYPVIYLRTLNRSDAPESTKISEILKPARHSSGLNKSIIPCRETLDIEALYSAIKEDILKPRLRTTPISLLASVLTLESPDISSEEDVKSWDSLPTSMRPNNISTQRAHRINLPSRPVGIFNGNLRVAFPYLTAQNEGPNEDSRQENETLAGKVIGNGRITMSSSPGLSIIESTAKTGDDPPQPQPSSQNPPETTKVMKQQQVEKTNRPHMTEEEKPVN